MGKKSKKVLSNGPSNAFDLGEGLSSVPLDVEPLIARFDSPEADFFAIIIQGIDRHRLRIFDTHTGTVSNDFSSERGDRFTCLSWGNVITDDLDGKVVG